jgi:predicted  nucleic acid-binding Zn-ribbon protein
MPHQCLNCGAVYGNTSDVILKGCPKCGGKLFIYLKKLPEKEEEIELSKEEKDLILKEVENISEIKDTDKPVILKLENVKVIKSGKYEIDINQLLRKEKPVIYKIQEGTYVIDLDFIRTGKQNNNKK